MEESDSELQEAFSKGLLKPGLNTVTTFVKREFKNNVAELKRKLAEMKLALPWAERLDLVNKPAPLAPELAFKMGEEERAREVQLRNMNRNRPVADLSADPVLNDLKRETLFYRQAQAAVLEGIPRLKALGVPTRRPDDYLAQMAKTDAHMQKVRKVLQKKQAAVVLSERARKQRQLRKLGKQIQIETKLRRDKEKRELREEVKKYRKGVRTDLDFLEANPKRAIGKGSGGRGPGQKGPASKKAEAKQKYKSKKFGFGGKKRGGKVNTRASAADVSEYTRPKGGPRGGAKGKARQQRPGKSKRIKMKSKKK
ncbi:probable rRNA-processing protein EBP2 homolog [Bacillus rossius redtenbacheri]|uniref:probable rRNA-processing protein EBP2 homolog n=1 Tax=Bacillus rossius redtenbacheri TaxID=93214 RepID=UPI002FDEF739